MDIDIDLKTSFDPIEIFEEAIPASMVNNGNLKQHPAGVYFQTIPTDKLTGLSAIPYNKAEQEGFTKFDFLHLSILDYFENKDQIKTLIHKEPDWFLLESAEVVKKLFQIHNHFDVVHKVKPKNVQELADCIALIRPAKRQLLSVYTKDKAKVREELYRKPEHNKYYFKRSHAIAYALTIVLQLHLIKAGIL